jgi:hypothetical protein
MQDYEVRCLNDKYRIEADNWSVGTEGLKFYQSKEVIAWFTSWEYWMVKQKNED